MPGGRGDRSPWTAKVTFGVTWWIRKEQLQRCLRSIKTFYPLARVDVVNTNGNLSRGRNKLVRRCRTPYFFLMEEDMRLTSETDVGLLKRVLDGDDRLLGVSCFINEPKNKRVKAVANWFVKCPHCDKWLMMQSNEINTRKHGTPYLTCNYTKNVGLFRIRHMKQFRWDEEYPVGEHIIYYHGVATTSDKLMALARTYVWHKPVRPTRRYCRGRVRARRLHEKGYESLGGKPHYVDDHFVRPDGTTEQHTFVTRTTQLHSLLKAFES